MSWNWPGKEGQPIRVIAFSNARQVELFLNGKSLGVQTMPQDGHLEWEVPYAPGRLTGERLHQRQAGGHRPGGNHGRPARIQLSPDRQTSSRPTGRTQWWFQSPFWMLKAGWFPMRTTVSPSSLPAAAGYWAWAMAIRATTTRTGPVSATPSTVIALSSFRRARKPDTLQLTATSTGVAPASVSFEVR